MTSQEDIARIQQELGVLSLQAVRIDLDAFIEACDGVASPQALAAGIDPRGVSSAGEWAEIARLLKPFRDEAAARIAAVREHLAPSDEDLVPAESGCPSCGERRVDELSLHDAGSVACATCGRRYTLPGEEGAGAA